MVIRLLKILTCINISEFGFILRIFLCKKVSYINLDILPYRMISTNQNVREAAVIRNRKYNTLKLII